MPGQLSRVAKHCTFPPFPLLSWLLETLLSKPRQFVLLAVRINLFVLNKPSGFGMMVDLDRAAI